MSKAGAPGLGADGGNSSGPSSSGGVEAPRHREKGLSKVTPPLPGRRDSDLLPAQWLPCDAWATLDRSSPARPARAAGGGLGQTPGQGHPGHDADHLDLARFRQAACRSQSDTAPEWQNQNRPCGPPRPRPCDVVARPPCPPPPAFSPRRAALPDLAVPQSTRCRSLWSQHSALKLLLWRVHAPPPPGAPQGRPALLPRPSGSQAGGRGTELLRDPRVVPEASRAVLQKEHQGFLPPPRRDPSPALHPLSHKPCCFPDVGVRGPSPPQGLAQRGGQRTWAQHGPPTSPALPAWRHPGLRGRAQALWQGLCPAWWAPRTVRPPHLGPKASSSAAPATGSRRGPPLAAWLRGPSQMWISPHLIPPLNSTRSPRPSGLRPAPHLAPEPVSSPTTRPASSLHSAPPPQAFAPACPHCPLCLTPSTAGGSARTLPQGARRTLKRPLGCPGAGRCGPHPGHLAAPPQEANVGFRVPPLESDDHQGS